MTRTSALLDSATTSITHVAMAVPPGTLTDTYRRAVLDFYGDIFGWRELTRLRRPDRLTIAIAEAAYINLRESTSATELEYEHFGVQVRSPEAVAALRAALLNRGVDVGPINEPVAGQPLFRFRHLLPLGVEVQHINADWSFDARADAP